jgi:hypothetical protein
VRNEQAASNSNDWNASQLSVALGDLVGEVATNSEQIGGFGEVRVALMGLVVRS